MNPRRAVLPVVSLLVAITFGCASIPDGVDGAKTLSFGFYDFKTQSMLVLVNESHPDFHDVYSTPRENATIKVMPDDELLDLIQSAASKGYFEYAEPGRVNVPNTFKMLVVSADGKDYSFPIYSGLGGVHPEIVQAFTDIQIEFSRVYNSIHQLQYISATSSGGSNYFERERERLRQENLDRIQEGGDR